jgi:hypothetical protein
LLTVLVLVGPRLTIVLWWLLAMDRWQAAFDSFWLPFLGFLFFPWTTLMYVIVAPTGTVSGWDWVFLGFAAFADLGSYSGGAYGNRERISGYGPRGSV